MDVRSLRRRQEGVAAVVVLPGEGIRSPRRDGIEPTAAVGCAVVVDPNAVSTLGIASLTTPSDVRGRPTTRAQDAFPARRGAPVGVSARGRPSRGRHPRGVSVVADRFPSLTVS
ncbi:hypothetical protein BRC88_01640 [Halobacteriales archaeon QS_4_69_225]|nr:MAG: hypothetical protein BRC88_01640 [Halobacteriales archaeon QS_4_69_225]